MGMGRHVPRILATLVPRAFPCLRDYHPAAMYGDQVIVSDCHFDGRAFSRDLVFVEISRGAIRALHRAHERSRVPSRAFDARGKTLLPGLIDAHCHLARTGLFEPQEPPSPEAVALNLRAQLQAGVTTAGDMGCPLPLIDALRSHTRRVPAAGPAIRAAGPLLTAPHGYPLDWMNPLIAGLGAAVSCPDRATARRAVERLAREGADHVKICIMHRGYGLAPLPVMSRSVVAAIVEAAHAAGLRVLAHAHWNADYRVALAAGVDALMHSAFDPLDEETVARVRDAGVAVCPTLWVFDSACLGAELRFDRDPERAAGVVAPVRASWRRFAEAYAASGDVLPAGIAGGLPKVAAKLGVKNAIANLLLLREAGVPFAFGTDGPYGFSVLGRPFDELLTLHRAGLDVAECLRAATAGAASLLGLADRGVLAEGARADLVVVDGDLSRDLEALGRVSAVFVAGERVEPEHAPLAGTRRAVLSGLAGTLRHAAVTQLSKLKFASLRLNSQ
jgi:imidazolonepropionase-like amidohydrolase